MLAVDAAGGDDTLVARALLKGNFPGGTVELNVRFDIEMGQIRRLENAA
jgi:hypothetical protein